MSPDEMPVSIVFDPKKFRTKQEKWGSYTVRHLAGGTVTIDEFDWRKAIKVHCTECMGGDHPRDCTDPLCALYRWRGKSNAILSRPVDERPDDTDTDNNL